MHRSLRLYRAPIVLGGLFLFFAISAGTASAETSLRLVGEPGSYILPGQTASYTPADGNFNAQRNYAQGVSATFFASGAYWYLDFVAPNQAPLEVGLYEDAGSFPSDPQERPRLRVFGSGGSCSELRGAFRIKQIEYGAGDAIQSLWVVFEERCSGATGSLLGELRYVADVAVALDAPLLRSVRRLELLSFTVSASSSAAGPIEITATGLPDGASFVPSGDRAGTFQWTPGARQIGRHRVTFTARDADGFVDSASTVVRVRGETSLRLASENGDYVGAGRTYAYGDTDSYRVLKTSRNGIEFAHPSYSYDDQWAVDLRGPNDAPLAVGTYAGAVEFDGDAAFPGMRAVADGRYCSSVRGDFVIKQIAYDAYGDIASLWARFEQHCNGASAALTGDLRYDAIVTVELSAPASRTVARGQTLRFDVGATDLEPGPIALSVTGAPPGSAFIYDGGRSGSFEWTPGADESGVYSVTFHARNVAGDEDSVQTRIRVTGQTSLTIDSDPGDPLANGGDYSYDLENARFTASLGFNNSVSVTVGDSLGSSAWSLTFAPPGGQFLAPGLYLDARASATAVNPGLSVVRAYSSCGSITGSFQIKQLVLSGSTVESLWAIFEQTCSNASGGLRGEIRYNADVRVVVSAPSVRTVVREEAVEFAVTASSLAPGPLTLSATHLPEGATFTDHGDRTGTFRWTPGIDQVGTHFVAFHARDGAGHEDSTFTAVRVTGLTSLAIESEPGDPIGSGGSYFYPAGAGIFQILRNPYDRSIRVSFREGLYGDAWEMNFAPPTGQDLYPALFDDVRGQPDGQHPGFLVSRYYIYGSCSQVEGQFQILALELDHEGQVTTFWATFDVHCVEARGWIHGEIRYNADVRLVVEAPAVMRVERGRPVAIGVQATQLQGRHVTLSAYALPPGATFADQGDDTGILQWTPGWDTFGDYVAGFLADDGAGGLATGRTRIEVVGASRLRMHSELGDSVGRGQDYAFDGHQDVFWAGLNTIHQTTVTVVPAQGLAWQVAVAASDTGALRPGTYVGARSVPTHTRPSLVVAQQNVYGYPGSFYPPCTSLLGNFRVKQARYDPDGSLRSLWILFEQFCGDALEPLTGELRFNADVVVAVTAPVRIETVPDREVSFEVTSENLAGGVTALAAIDAPRQSLFVDHGDGTGTFSWAPGADDLGLHPILFVASGEGRTDTTVTYVRVKGLSLLQAHSEPGDPIGQGKDVAFGDNQGVFDAVRNAANGISIRYRSRDHAEDWTLEFAAPGNALLTPGVYAPASRYPFQERTRPGLDVRANGRSCATLIGSFTVHQAIYGPDDQIIAFRATFTERCNGAGPALSGEIEYNAGATTPTLASFVSADVTPEEVRLTWQVGARDRDVVVERRKGEAEWAAMARLLPDGTGRVVFTDADVAPGERIGYRLAVDIEGMVERLAEHWVEFPARVAFALERVWPNPTSGPLNVSFALPEAAPATLEVVDVTGRRVAAQDVTALGPGRHRWTLPEGLTPAAGIYAVRLTQGGRSQVMRVCVIR